MSLKAFALIIPSINLIETVRITFQTHGDRANKEVGIKVIYVVSAQKEPWLRLPNKVIYPVGFYPMCF